MKILTQVFFFLFQDLMLSNGWAEMIVNLWLLLFMERDRSINRYILISLFSNNVCVCFFERERECVCVVCVRSLARCYFGEIWVYDIHTHTHTITLPQRLMHTHTLSYTLTQSFSLSVFLRHTLSSIIIQFQWEGGDITNCIEI